MKTNEQMIADIIKRKEEYDAKRGERNRRVRITAAVLATVIIAAAIPATVFIAAAGKAPAPAAPPETETAVTQEASGNETTAEDVTTGNGAATEKDTTENHETTVRETVPPETETEAEQHISYSPSGGPFQFGIVADFYEKDKVDPIVLTKEEYGRHKWLNKNTVRQYMIDLPTGDHLPDDYDYDHCDYIFYGYKKQGDIYEIELKLKNTNRWAGDEYLVRIESDGSAEILSEDTIKSVFPTVKNPEWDALDPGDYVSIPLKFKFTKDIKFTDFKIYIFKRSAGNEFHPAQDDITEAEEYFASGKSMSDKAYPGWQEVKSSPLIQAARSYYMVRFIETKGYNFIIDSNALFCTTEFYERVALYFGDVDENGVPIFITERDHPDYQNPFKLPMIADRPGYNSEIERVRGDVMNASPDFDFKKTKALDSKGGVLKQYSINIYGYIKWSINNNDIIAPDDGLRPAQNVMIKIFDNSISALINYVYTASDGYYNTTFTAYSAEPLDLRIEVWLCNNTNDIILGNLDDPIIHKEINSFYGIPFTASYLASYNFVNGVNGTITDNLNRSVSTYQALILADSYIKSIQNSQILPTNALYNPVITILNSSTSYYFSNDIELKISYKDAFDWDVIQHEYGHYIEEIYEFYNNNGFASHDITRNLNLDYSKDTAIRLAWDEGWATFFAINAQRVMNAANLNVPNVGDTNYSNYEEQVTYYINNNIDVDIELFVNNISNEPIDSSEATEATIAALLLDLVDGVSVTDNDITYISDTAIWNMIIGDTADDTDNCHTLSNFMNAFHDSTLITNGQKLNATYLLRRYDLNPYNVSLQNINSSSPLVTWTNVSTSYHNRIRIFDSSYNEIYTSPFLIYQTSYNIPAADWTQIKTGRNYVIIVVEGIQAMYPLTGGYYSSFGIVYFT